MGVYMSNRVSNEALLEAGLTLMGQAGKPMQKTQSGSRAMLFRLESGKTVRVRTCNDHVLVVVADSPKLNANLNIEGTDYLLIVMPEVPRTLGPVVAYCVPTTVAVKDVRKTHAEWLASNPATKGDNRTWNIWFDDAAKAGGFAKHWAKYRLGGTASVSPQNERSSTDLLSDSRKLGDVISVAKAKIAEAAGVSIDSVRISVDLG